MKAALPASSSDPRPDPSPDAAIDTDDARWRAIVQRDARADGAFFYGVRTTGVFCRPSCASRQPRRENVAFFASAEAARAAGYRDCKRCQPGGLPREIDIVRRACAILDAALVNDPASNPANDSASSPAADPAKNPAAPKPARPVRNPARSACASGPSRHHATRHITLAQLGEAVHLSPFHLQRLFKRVLGISPREYQAAQRGAALRDALQHGASVTRTREDAGFGSSSQLYRSAPGELGMSPSAWQRKGAGLTIRYALAHTPQGQVIVAATPKGICRIAFDDEAAALVTDLRAMFANAQLIEDPAAIAPFIAQIDAWLNGARTHFDLPLDVAASAFQQRVWDALRRIPYGETRSYTQLAHALGIPRAVRAVASACASNPVALVIACHRVVQKNGALAGYRWGLPRKAALLELERRERLKQSE